MLQRIEISNTKIFRRRDKIYINSPVLHLWSVIRVWRCQNSVLSRSVTPLRLNPRGCWTAWPLHSDLRAPLHPWWSTNKRFKRFTTTESPFDSWHKVFFLTRWGRCVPSLRWASCWTRSTGWCPPPPCPSGRRWLLFHSRLCAAPQREEAMKRPLGLWPFPLFHSLTGSQFLWHI